MKNFKTIFLLFTIISLNCQLSLCNVKVEVSESKIPQEKSEENFKKILSFLNCLPELKENELTHYPQFEKDAENCLEDDPSIDEIHAGAVKSLARDLCEGVKLVIDCTNQKSIQAHEIVIRGVGLTFKEIAFKLMAVAMSSGGNMNQCLSLALQKYMQNQAQTLMAFSSCFNPDIRKMMD